MSRAMLPAFQSGLTLVETVIVIALYTLLSGVLFTTIQSLYQNNAYAIAQSSEVDNGRRAIIRWARDAREMTFAENGFFPILIADPNHLAFFSDTDNNGEAELVAYELVSSTTLERRIHHPTGFPASYDLVTPDTVEISSEFVQNMTFGTSTFFYFDNTGTLIPDGTARLTDIVYIEAQFIVNVDPIQNPGEFVLRNSVAPRNLKDNL